MKQGKTQSDNRSGFVSSNKIIYNPELIIAYFAEKNQCFFKSLL